jgi:hypothetical protein
MGIGPAKTSAQARRIHVGCFSVLGVLYVVVYLPMLLLTFVFGGGLGGAAGWLKGTFWFALPGLIIVAVLGFKNAPRRVLAVVTAVVLLLSLSLGAVAARRNPPDPARLSRTLDAAGVPEEWKLIDESSFGGSCFDVCPNVTRTYVAPTDPEGAVEEVHARFGNENFEMGPIESWPDDEYTRFRDRVTTYGDGDKRDLQIEAGVPWRSPSPEQNGQTLVVIRPDGREVP